MSYRRYLFIKTVSTGVTILLVMVGLFFLFRLLPGDFTARLALAGATPEQIEAARERAGLGKPLYIQFITFVENMLTGNAGTSYSYNIPVVELTITRLFYSAVLIGPAVITAFIIGTFSGADFGMSSEGFKDKFGSIFVMVAGAIPQFFLAILLIEIFAIWLDLFPTSGVVATSNLQIMNDPFELIQTSEFWWHYSLPFLTVVLHFIYIPTLLMRTSVVEVMNEDFIYYHKIKKLKNRTQLRRIIRHSIIPVITVFPISMSRALSGMVLVEIVFNWPGIGKLLIESVFSNDLPVLQFAFILVAAWVILANYFIDILYPLIDPRISLSSSEQRE